ncbi:hypothetical protein DT381_29575 [Pseudomonas aeruginosa]|uniref:hypothetical protein n=1 Tax=Pseudomonas aeruginosa TaxID=287 RepID=UPI00071B1D8E|nr:hypothetical protein [Pseudomonas aeruginosa]KSO15552.1 hypothetical protein APA84_08410 [Pseudomonas aeruginosa]RCI46592.1 hypothetical protein DT381_29575 [Pseudomonas aeruginosa]HCF6977198.1 hypothetical protein [Pseudomonas aeruginosa]
MSDVLRFDSVLMSDVYESKNGEYVQYTDYAKLEAEAQALREEVAALRARVVVPDRRDPLNSTGDDENPRYAGFNECLDELARLNGMTVSEGLLRRIVTPALTSSDAQDRIGALEELRALLSEQEGGKQ